MRLQIRWRGIMRSAALEAHVERRVQLASGKWTGRVDTVRVWLADVNGPRGGVDKRCAVEVDGPVGLRRVQVCDADVYAAVDRALGAMSRAVVRAAQLHAGPRRRMREESRAAPQ